MSRRQGRTVRLAFAGLWFRRGTTLIVLALATVASSAAVVAPLYARGAEESIVRDSLGRADAFTRSVQVSSPPAGVRTTADAAEDVDYLLRTAERVLGHPAFGTPRLSWSASAVYLPASGDYAGFPVDGRVVERAEVCAHLTLTSGRCPGTATEGLLTRRSLELLDAAVGDTLTVQVADVSSVKAAVPTAMAVRVVGAFDPRLVQSPYWAGRPYFASFYPRAAQQGLEAVPPVADPVFLGTGAAALAGVTTYTVDIPLIAKRVQIDDSSRLSEQIRRFTAVTTRVGVSTYSPIPATLAAADDGRHIVRLAAPIAVVQLVLLSWWTMFLVVGAATEERSPELGLAKLRGLTTGQTRAFGLAEVYLLLAVAAPLGTMLGFLAVRLMADQVFAPGTPVVFTSTAVLTVVGTAIGGAITAALSSRQILRRPVSELLRRVPPRGRGRVAGVVEGALAVLTVLGSIQLVSDRGSSPSPLALLAPGAMAFAGGLLAARLLVRLARGRTEASLSRGSAAGAAGWAGIARRPVTARVASLIAVATAFLLVGVQAWVVAERNWNERAAAETGAEVVLQVRAPGHRDLLEAVRAADPSGTYAMAAVQVSSSNPGARMLAVDSSRADRVIAWGAPSARPTTSVRDVLRPALARSLMLGAGRLVATLVVTELSSPSPLRLTARLDRSGQHERLDLGSLRRGAGTYSAQLPPECAPDRCRLAALGLGHPGTDIEAATAGFSVRSLELAPVGGGAGTLLAGDFADPGAWRPGAPNLGGPTVIVRPGVNLDVEVSAPGGPVAEIVRGDSLEPLPAYVPRSSLDGGPEAGDAPFAQATGLAGQEIRYLTTQTVDYLPRMGDNGVLVDLDLALRLNEDAALGDQQVWLSRDDVPLETALRAALRAAKVTIVRRETRSALERSFATDGAALGLRLLLVCGAAALLVAVGALLVAAYVGRRQRAYEVAAFRVVGVRRRTVRAMLLQETLGTVFVALGCGVAAAAVATWAVLPALPQFDDTSTFVDVRFAAEQTIFWASAGALAAFLAVIGFAVASLQLRMGRLDRLREGV